MARLDPRGAFVFLRSSLESLPEASGTTATMATKHLVKDGECIESIAFAHGHAPTTIHRYPNNGALLQARGSLDTLIPGDELVIPDKRSKEATVVTDAQHRFRRKGVPARFRVFLRDEGAPRAGIAYTLSVDGEERTGHSSAEGRVERWISPAAQRAELRLETGEIYSFALGRLRPVSEPEGVSARLRNLGYAVLDGDPTSLELALAAFQLDHGGDGTGQLDDQTRQLLHDVHGS